MIWWIIIIIIIYLFISLWTKAATHSDMTYHKYMDWVQEQYTQMKKKAQRKSSW